MFIGIGTPITLGQGVGPAWMTGMNLGWDFVRDQYFLGATTFTDTHAQTIYAKNSAGVYSPFAANVLTRTDLGLQTIWTRTNLFLNSFAVATQTVTVVSSTTYTVSITGSGSITLSGAGTGTVTAGNPVTFTAGTTSLTCTVTGSPSTCNVEAGTFASPPIQTAGTSVTVNGNQQTIALGSLASGGVAGIIQFNMIQPTVSGTSTRQLEINDGTANNFITMFRRNLTGNFAITAATGAVSQGTVDSGVTFAAGVFTLAFAAGPGYLQMQVVGYAEPASSGLASYPPVTTASPAGQGFSAGINSYQLTRKLALKFGPQNASTFAAAFAAAQLAAVSP